MKVLIVNPHTDAGISAGKYKRFLAPMPPVSLAYLCASLEKADIPVAFYDDFLNGGDPEKLAKYLDLFKPDLVGLPCLTPMAKAVFQVAGAIRKTCPATKIVMGNLHASLFAEEILRAGHADYIVSGEGEETLVDLARTLDAHGEMAKVNGVSWLDGERFIKNPPRPYVKNLDEIPFPAWHLLEVERYRLFNFAVVEEPATLICGSRGCPYECSFCSLKVMGHGRRARSAKNIADEMEYFHEKYGMKEFAFVDAIFPISKKEGLEFADELIRRGLHKKMCWVTETRVDLVDYDLLKRLRESGMRRLMFGLETGDEDRLKDLNKKFNVAKSYEAIKLCRDLDIQTIGFFMIGLPGDTVDSIERTIEFAVELNVDFAKYSVFVPYPGTSDFEELLAKGKLNDPYNWDLYTSWPTEESTPVFVPDRLTNKEVVRLQKKAFVKSYIRPYMVWRHFVEIRSFTLGDVINGIKTILGF